jgi:hypothetical protein
MQNDAGRIKEESSEQMTAENQLGKQEIKNQEPSAHLLGFVNLFV